MSGLLMVLVIAVLIAINALCVAAEFGLLGAPRTAIERLAHQGNKTAWRVHQVLEDSRRQDRFIATTQLGIAIASLALGMYGEHALAERLKTAFAQLGDGSHVLAHGAASGIALGLMTYLHVVIGEMVPKTLALGRPERVALWTMPPMLAIGTLLAPFVIVLERVGYLVLRLLGIPRHEASVSRYYSTAELAEIVEESQVGGLLHPESSRVVQDLFEFGERTASEAMVPRVRIHGIPLGCPPDELQGVIGSSLHTRFPVYKGDLDHIMGTVHARHLIQCLRDAVPVGVDMIRPVPFVPETARLDKVLQILRREKAHMVVVMDEHGGTAGLVSIEDLFEEVVGEIDEGQAGKPHARVDLGGGSHVAGTMRLDELGEALGRTLTHEHADTVSGLVLMLLDRPAKVGDTVHELGLRFEVTAIQGRGVKECLVTVDEPTEPATQSPP